MDDKLPAGVPRPFLIGSAANPRGDAEGDESFGASTRRGKFEDGLLFSS